MRKFAKFAKFVTTNFGKRQSDKATWKKITKVQKSKKQLIYSIEGREKQLVSFLKEKYKKKNTS